MTRADGDKPTPWAPARRGDLALIAEGRSVTDLNGATQSLTVSVYSFGVVSSVNREGFVRAIRDVNGSPHVVRSSVVHILSADKLVAPVQEVLARIGNREITTIEKARSLVQPFLKVQPK